MSHDDLAAQRLADRALDAALHYHQHAGRVLRTAHEHLVAAALAAQVAAAEDARRNRGAAHRARTVRDQHERVADVYGQLEALTTEGR